MYKFKVKLMLVWMRARRRAGSPANLNGFVRFAERLNLVSAGVPSRFQRALTLRRVRTIIVAVEKQ